MQLDDRAAADNFVAEEPLNKAGVYERVEIHRWSNSFGKRAADYRPQGNAAVPVHGAEDRHAGVLPRAPARPRSPTSRRTATSFIFRGPIRSADGADNIGTALLLELPDRAAADKFWTEEPFSKNGGYDRDARIVRWVFGD